MNDTDQSPALGVESGTNVNAGRPPRPRVAFLDGLRGIAALFVVFGHSAAALFPAVVFGSPKGGFASCTRRRSSTSPHTGGQVIVRFQRTWPWVNDIVTAFTRLHVAFPG